MRQWLSGKNGKTADADTGRRGPIGYPGIAMMLLVLTAVGTMLGGAYELELRGGVRVRTGRQYKNVIQKLVKT